MTMATKTPVTMLVLALLAAPVPGAAEAAVHGEATLEASVTSAPAGTTVTLTGALFSPGEAHRLVLRGTLDDYEIGTVTAGADSTFVEEISIPRGVRPGNYRLVAIAPDGDEVATLDLPVLAARETAGTSGDRAGAAEGGDGSVGHAETDDGTPTREARADEIRIERSRAGVEWGVIGLVIGLAGGLGATLLRRS